MRNEIYVLFIFLLVGCKTTQVESKLLKNEIITEYYKSGKIKSIGRIDEFHKKFSNFRVELWNEFYENGNLRASGNYKLDSYTECCTEGVCDLHYSYKYGIWIYYFDNGELKATGTYRIDKKHKETNCEGGVEINFGFVSDSWKFYDKNGKEVNSTKKCIAEIEKTSILNEWDMMKR